MISVIGVDYTNFELYWEDIGRFSGINYETARHAFAWLKCYGHLGKFKVNGCVYYSQFRDGKPQKEWAKEINVSLNTFRKYIKVMKFYFSDVSP